MNVRAESGYAVEVERIALGANHLAGYKTGDDRQSEAKEGWFSQNLIGSGRDSKFHLPRVSADTPFAP